MNILYTANDLFVEKVATSMCSVFENNKEIKDICVYFIGQGISEENKEKLRQLSSNYKREIKLINLENLNNYFNFEFDTLGWNPIILARLLLDKLLPNTINKILYLDGDTVNIQSLKKLWDIDLKDNVLGACIEATVDANRKEQLGLKDYPYINSGVLLFNLSKWRDENWGEKIIEHYKNSQGRMFAADQDVINAVLKDNIYYLPPKYNFYNIYWFYPYKTLKKLMGNAYYYDTNTYNESLKNPAIIHYLGEERPWRKGNKHKFLADYRKYHSKTPWADEPEEAGWELYFVCWNIFNIVTRPFPLLRYRIINKLIPWFMKWRKKQLAKKKDR